MTSQELQVKMGDFFYQVWLNFICVASPFQQKEQDVESEAIVISFDVSAPKFQLSVKLNKKRENVWKYDIDRRLAKLLVALDRT